MFLTHVSTITQDTSGFIWFGASNGLYRYDAYDFKPYLHDEENRHSVSDNNINVVYLDKEGMLWVGTRNGLNCYYSNSSKFQHFLAGDSSNSGEDVCEIKQDKFGNYWIGTLQNGLFLLSNKKTITADSLTFTITHFTYDSANASSISDNSINSILFDENDNCWIATYGGLNRFNLSKHISTNLAFEHFIHDDKDNSSIFSNDLYKLYEDNHHRIWIVNLNNSIDLIQQSNKISFQHFFPLQNVTNDNSAKTLLNIFIDGKNRAWIASKAFGLLLYDVNETNGITSFINMRRFAYDKTDPSSLSDDFIWKNFQDKNDLMWIGTYKGISKCNIFSEQFNVIKTDDDKVNLKKTINCIYKKNQTTWIGSDHNVIWMLNNNKSTEFILSAKELSLEENKENYPLSIFISKKQNLYIGTARGLFFYTADKIKNILSGKNNTKTLHISPQLLLGSTVFSVKEINGFIYAGAGNGFYKLDESGLALTRLINDKQFGYAIRCITSDNENIWLATEGGLLCYHPSKKSFEIYKHTIGDTTSISSSLVETVFTDKDNSVWAGTQFGLNKFIYQTKKFKTYHIKDGLPDEQIAGITQDENGNLWVATYKGISQFNPVSNTFRNFNEQDGLNAMQYQRNCIFSNEKLILAGCDKGFNSFYPDSLHTNTKPPAIQFTDFSIFTTSVFNNGFEKLKDAFAVNKELILNYQQNFFNISFAALNFLNTEKNQYAYKLEGVNDSWVYCGNIHNANYTDVAPGHYTFKVKAANNDGVWNEQGISIPITVLPPWWKTWWFSTLAILNVLALTFLSIRFYFKQKLKAQQQKIEKLKAIENVRSKISMDIHDEIGSQLTKISLLSQRIKLSYEKKKEVDSLLIDKITESSKEVVGNLSEIIWTVNPKHDNLQSLLAYIRNYIANFFEHTTIAYIINFPDETPFINISPDLKHNLFLVIKESLNNIIKHAEATKVEISFQFTTQTFCFEIIDDGKGMADIKGRDFGNGLINMRNRMEAVNGKFEIESEKNKGTKIILKAKFI